MVDGPPKSELEVALAQLVIEGVPVRLKEAEVTSAPKGKFTPAVSPLPEPAKVCEKLVLPSANWVSVVAADANGSKEQISIIATKLIAMFLIPRVLRSIGGPLGTVRSSISMLWVLDERTIYQNSNNKDAFEEVGLRCREQGSGRNSSGQ